MTARRKLWTFSIQLISNETWVQSTNRWQYPGEAAEAAAEFLRENAECGIEVAVRLIKLQEGQT